MPYEQRAQGARPRTRTTSFCPYVERPGQRSSTWTRSAAAGLKLGVDPLGGAAVPLLGADREIYGLDITVVNPKVDPTFSFMTVDHDGKIRMDCSSPVRDGRPRRR